MEKKQFWPDEQVRTATWGGYLEIRSEFALQFIHHFALIAGKDGLEDSAGRHTINLMPVDEVVDRAFALADAFTNKALERGELRAPTLSKEEIAKRAGELETLKRDASWQKLESSLKSRKTTADDTSN